LIGDGTGALSEDERAELARLRKEKWSGIGLGLSWMVHSRVPRGPVSDGASLSDLAVALSDPNPP